MTGMTIGRLLPKANDEQQIDYGPLMGFGAATVRVNPHTHIAPASTEANLREVVEIIRAKQATAATSS